jgi:hypothetical protein
MLKVQSRMEPLLVHSLDPRACIRMHSLWHFPATLVCKQLYAGVDTGFTTAYCIMLVARRLTPRQPHHLCANCRTASAGMLDEGCVLPKKLHAQSRLIQVYAGGCTLSMNVKQLCSKLMCSMPKHQEVTDCNVGATSKHLLPDGNLLNKRTTFNNS